MTADLTGWATLALAVVTAVLAAAAFAQIVQSRRAEERQFQFAFFRLAQSQSPIVVAEITSAVQSIPSRLMLRNVGSGAALNVRFSGILNHKEFSAAQYAIPAIGAGEQRVVIEEAIDELAEFLCRYEDVFGNVYATEYLRLTATAAWYVWRRPYIGRGLLPRPEFCSEDHPAWGFKGRVYLDASQGLW